MDPFRGQSSSPKKKGFTPFVVGSLLIHGVFILILPSGLMEPPRKHEGLNPSSNHHAIYVDILADPDAAANAPIQEKQQLPKALVAQVQPPPIENTVEHYIPPQLTPGDLVQETQNASPPTSQNTRVPETGLLEAPGQNTLDEGVSGGEVNHGGDAGQDHSDADVPLLLEGDKVLDGGQTEIILNRVQSLSTLGKRNREGDNSAFGAGADPRQGHDSVRATQTLRDIILSQILPFWQLSRFSVNQDHGITGHVILGQDGMLAPPFRDEMAWDPEGAMPQYSEATLAGDEYTAGILLTLYAALRMAQPFELPADVQGPWPKRVSVSLNFSDIPSTLRSPKEGAKAFD